MTENERTPGGPDEEVREGVGPVQPMDPARRQSRPAEARPSAPPSPPATDLPPAAGPPAGRPQPVARPPSAVPRTGARRPRASMLGAVDRVRRTDFPIVLRGYDRAAVDAYVADVAQLVAELEATQLPETVVERALDDVGEQTSAILKRAHEAAEEIASRSRAQADARIEQAERDAELTRREAEEHVGRLEGDIRALWEERQRLIDDVRHLADDVLALADDAIDRIPPPGDERGEDEPADVEQTQSLAREDVAAAAPPTPAPPEGAQLGEGPATEPVVEEDSLPGDATAPTDEVPPPGDATAATDEVTPSEATAPEEDTAERPPGA